MIKPITIAASMLGFSLLLSSVLQASEWQEYSARYSLYRNGKLAGKADMEFKRNGDTWVMSTAGSGTHGLARLLRLRDREFVEGRFNNGQFIPLRFEHKVSLAGIGNEWSAQFDWPNDKVLIELEKSSVELDLQGEALDGLSLKLEMQRRLRAGEKNMKFFLVDEDEIKEQEWKVLPSIMLETSLGCLETIPVERIRREGSSRYTRAWYAPALEYVTVRLEHGKTDGDHMEMRIAELEQANKPFAPGTGCSAQQSG